MMKKDELLKFLMSCGARGAINVAVQYHQGVNYLQNLQSSHNSVRKRKSSFRDVAFSSAQSHMCTTESSSTKQSIGRMSCGLQQQRSL
jgi:hypothetical protein